MSLLTVGDSSGSRTYVYDTAGRLQQVTTVYSGLPGGHNTFVLSYTYNGDGSVATMTSPVGTTGYQYNKAGALTQVTDPNNVVTSYSFDHIGRRTGQTTSVPNGQTLSAGYTWGVSGQAGDPSIAPVYLRQISQSVGSQTWTYTLTHSLLGQLTRQDETSSQANLNGFSVFAYDLRGRLNSENLHWRANANTAYDVSSGYSFDAANNVQAGANGWTVNSSNQVTSAPFVAGSSGLAGATGLSYDVAGNTHALNGGALGYNVWGDLNSLSLPGNVSVSYGYDSSGRRLSKTAGTATTYYLYEGDALLAELNSSGNITRQYTWGATGLVSDRSIVGASTQTRLYVFDGLGNTRALMDGSSGSVLWQGAWSAWGQPNCASVPASPYGYHGQTGAYLDSESGLLKMGARYYAPCLGRFLTRDPSGWSNGANLYAFCIGDPIDFFDANGCESSLMDSLWSGLAGADAINRRLGPLGCPPLHSLMESHDAFANWGEAAGNTKVTPHDTLVAAAYAGAHFADTTMQFAGPALAAVNKLSACAGRKCFVAGTPVWVAEKDKAGQWQVRSKPIEQVKAGEYVIARNETTGKTDYKQVLRTSVKHAEVVVSVTLAEAKSGQAVETITATREHPFFVEGKGFTPAGGLAIGNAIVTRAVPALVVKDMQWKRQAQGYAVYNFLVDDDHTYFVGNAYGGAWVHNPPWCPILLPLQKRLP